MENSNHSPNRIGAIEAGGTKFVCAVGDGTDGTIAQCRTIPTADPASTLRNVTDWLIDQQQGGPLSAIGVASFGPIDLNKHSPTFGHITTTPKPGWQNVDLLGHIARTIPNIPIGFDTDVNGAALGERQWGAARGLDDFLYITIGTGIGGGGMCNGRLLHGLLHPEMGHLRLARIPGDTWHGICPFHGDCWEGLCCGPAIQARWGRPASELPPDHPAWEVLANCIGQAFASLTCVLSPRRIILGGSIRKGGLLGEERFFQMIRAQTLASLNNYIQSSTVLEQSEHYIVPPLLGDQAGIIGAIALGTAALRAA